MRIYGIKLPSKLTYVHEDDYDSCEEEYTTINPEKQYSSACHLYVNDKGSQFVGFELSLGLSEDEMRLLLGKNGKIYKVIPN